MHDPWDPLSITEVRDRFIPFDVDWWIAGGHAIDLFLGWQTRPHADLDVEMFRQDRDILFDVFDGWDLHFVSESQLHRWERGQPIDDAVFGVWGRPAQDAPWSVEVMLADGDHDTWRFRRDNEISRRRAQLTHSTPDGVPYCAPEVQLLFKAKKRRQKDDVDMIRCLHRMERSQRQWLVAALRRLEPTHPWLDLLDQVERGGTE